MMEAAFDKAAIDYDSTFTDSKIGSLVRKRVWDYIDKNFPSNTKLNILELNCGTGADAIYFARKGYKVIATDISSEMIVKAKIKVDGVGGSNRINFMKLDITDLDPALFNEKFDLVFSNFGGLNCIPPDAIGNVAGNIKNVLTERGRFIAVVMSKYCFWEILFYLLKGDTDKSFRRIKNDFLEVNVSGSIVKTYYYSPGNILSLFRKEFQLHKLIPIGFFLPPTYLEKFFSKKDKSLSVLNKLEVAVEPLSFLSHFADHFLIDLKVAR